MANAAVAAATRNAAKLAAKQNEQAGAAISATRLSNSADTFCRIHCRRSAEFRRGGESCCSGKGSAERYREAINAVA